MAVVYQHIRLDINEVFYVGIGKSEKRAFTKQGRNQHWKNIVNKYGYYVEIIYQDLTWLLACQMEQYLISEYGRYDLGEGNLVNMTAGGDGTVGYKHKAETIHLFKKPKSEDLKKKLSEIRKGSRASDVTKLKMSVSQTGRLQSEKCKEKLRNRKFSNETRKKMSEWQKGIPKSEITKQKLSESNKGNISWNKGIPMSENTKQKLKGPKSEEHKQKMRKPKQLTICPHCNLKGGSNNMKRYHFDNCKLNFNKND
jgi:hypothetical protein